MTTQADVERRLHDRLEREVNKHGIGPVIYQLMLITEAKSENPNRSREERIQWSEVYTRLAQTTDIAAEVNQTDDEDEIDVNEQAGIQVSPAIAKLVQR